MARKPTGAAGAYTVIRSPLSHDGETYQPGERIELTEAEALPLLGVGAIEAVAAKEPPAKGPPPKEPPKT